jgi:DNA replication protein DnaC
MNPIVSNYLKLVEKNKAQPKVIKEMSFNDMAECWIATGKMKTPNYQFDECAKEIMKLCYSPKTRNKGAVICGVKGIGKTLNMDVFATMNTNLFSVNTMCYEVAELEMNYKANGAVVLERISLAPCLVINDAGAENLLNDYGTHRNIVTDILLLRYRQFQKYGYKTYLTTNFSWEAFCTHYGARLADRFKEMFNAIEIRGESKR